MQKVCKSSVLHHPRLSILLPLIKNPYSSMKSITQLLTAALFLMTFAANAQSNGSNDEALTGKARAAAHECLQEYAGMNITAGVEATGICFAGGSTYRVTFSAAPRCVGNGPCLFYIIQAAVVDFDCEGKVINVGCQGF
jgi:hypothetical protein